MDFPPCRIPKQGGEGGTRRKLFFQGQNKKAKKKHSLAPPHPTTQLMRKIKIPRVSF